MEVINENINEFQITKNVIFGSGASKLLCNNDLVRNSKKICVISDKGLESAGIVKEFISTLNKQSEEVVSFTDIIGEPSFQLIGKAVDFIQNQNVDLVIGIGGGSALDVAKATSALCDKNNISSYYNGDKIIESRTVNCILLPTTSGTGSEVTKNAIFG